MTHYFTTGNESTCYGCRACEHICPQKAITMKPNEEGFLYPTLDEAICMKCGLCSQVCPNDNVTTVFRKPLKVFAAQYKQQDVLDNSSSGGIFSAVADYVLENNGSVAGCVFDDNFTAIHVVSQDHDTVAKMRGSKYVQSDMENSYSSVKEDLLTGKKVLFTGTPCQVDGLKSYLGGNTEDLYTCDLICHGVPSPKVWSAHIGFIEKLNKSKLSRYFFRPKDWSWHIHNEKAIFKNGKTFCSTGYSNMFRCLYYSGLIMRPSCYKCQYSDVNRCSDITIADCRGVDRILSLLNSDEGVSLVLVNTPRGAELFSAVAKNTEYYPININDVLQPPLQHPCVKNRRREEFWNLFLSKGYTSAIYRIYGRFYNIKYNIKKNIKRVKK